MINSYKNIVKLREKNYCILKSNNNFVYINDRMLHRNIYKAVFLWLFLISLFERTPNTLKADAITKRG